MNGINNDKERINDFPGPADEAGTSEDQGKGVMAVNAEAEPELSGAVSLTRPLIFLLVVAGLFIIARALNLQEYLQEDRLRRFIASYGIWAPLVYLLVWTIAPSLFLPGLPILLAGGILFGPFWGMAYSSLGTLAGSSLAFLVARYLARDWVSAKIRGSKLARLDDQVARHDWKIVAFSRLIPVSPFFLLNYAFGLTRIRFLPYALATFFGMLPGIIAYVLFSSKLPQLLQGEVSVWLIIGVCLIAVVSLLPVIYRRVKSPRGEPLEF